MKTINVKSGNQPEKSKRRIRLPFSTLELGVFLVVLATLLVAGFIVLAPKRAIDDVADSRRKTDIARIYDGITLLLIDEGGEVPTYAGGEQDIPDVTTINILDLGVDVEQLDNFSPKYVTTLPKDPDGNSYKVGLLANGRVAVATRLSTGEIYIVSESDPTVVQRALEDNANNDEEEERKPGVIPGGVPTGDFGD